jgi:hypothetical protein
MIIVVHIRYNSVPRDAVLRWITAFACESYASPAEAADPD